MARQVRNLTAVAWVIAEAQGLKDLVLPKLWLRFDPWCRELPYALGVAMKKREREKEKEGRKER